MPTFYLPAYVPSKLHTPTPQPSCSSGRLVLGASNGSPEIVAGLRRFVPLGGRGRPPLRVLNWVCLGNEHYFAEHLAGFHVFVGRASISQRERAVHDRFYATRKYMAQDVMQLTQRAHIRAKEVELARKQKAQVGRGIVPGGRAAGDNRPSRLERFHAFLPGSGTDMLDHNVHAFFVGDLPHFLRDFLLIMIDAVIRA